MSAFASPAAFDAALADLAMPDAAAAAAARARQDDLTKPPGSLGRLEDIAVFMAGWQGRERPVIARGRTAIFAGNHGFMVHGVSAFPTSVTAGMVANFAAGGAAINALAGVAGLELMVVPLDLDRPTADFTCAPAMTEAECLAALNAGAAVVTPDLDILTLGEMGIGNTTAAAALCARSLGGGAAEWAGPGTGLDAAGVARKVAVIARALAFHADAPHTPFETLRRLGGREIAAMAGAVLRARALRIPVVLDGFITCAALAPLAVVAPGIVDHCLAGHCSAEPGHVRLLARLGLVPLLNLGMRLGEGSGAAVAVGVIRAALAAHDQMATFAQAGVASGVAAGAEGQA
ncbi:MULTISPECIES: nicotinate-nucleotide--dimethylbenzimidazole phosphoribosyltransferase [unclassified Novosphingobium]|uniref:nicotinate-nucleotide--dimethylbenzimidazole phosphoribosyltransferase n=1 Tax=unclassified Novosphingobium TaxID=2644732 RepID=UPI000D30F2FE|nr:MULTISPECIES: nicotinate-nucleotide--dimethylbenzimidazole phosphoribosyltransferase [unclassified Novosphingobium]PTR07566.1 nicotinate-nucleotide-dimethylbenzimidazole phosphoribosyltransferase [Novosphingobium sp. GV055]PUB00268.1 nicotinate-nucleotide-dimethylbenzimidazole phosphoribosyltransferase [Novosphingobium sp. GV061]PUB15309.1 nicotinate-nucleotide-dimethylbenzimidazole phosphoribosyltransferase [Novosphingobium sp. GV079]PUB39185.1 nicotinate-nucleotide-dimethylbenzimidazole ph